MKQKCCLSISNTSAGLMWIKGHGEFPKLKGVLVLMHKLTDSRPKRRSSQKQYSVLHEVCLSRHWHSFL